ncbi:hypothetical protein [Sphingomonas sp. CFBP9021]|uniref:hypothetical protein n=1 Tax=Sphingomonas sp. CFBP9021 TaxID=3096534 RepID=UPI002A6A73D9|nr:hypothetical protein [Sphingomonas sp. CFBP9021]MDY0969088.1 hypothetical protein [Sphingomonas sp. CFBP9021]
MPRSSSKPADLPTIETRKKALLAELAQLEEQAKAAEIAARDAGRPVLLAALDRIKIAAMEKSDAKVIASVINQHGGSAVASHLASIPQAARTNPES